MKTDIKSSMEKLSEALGYVGYAQLTQKAESVLNCIYSAPKDERIKLAEYAFKNIFDSNYPRNNNLDEVPTPINDDDYKINASKIYDKFISIFKSISEKNLSSTEFTTVFLSLLDGIENMKSRSILVTVAKSIKLLPYNFIDLEFTSSDEDLQEIGNTDTIAMNQIKFLIFGEHRFHTEYDLSSRLLKIINEAPDEKIKLFRMFFVTRLLAVKYSNGVHVIKVTEKDHPEELAGFGENTTPSSFH